ncbi:acyl-coenzyme A thioesterase 9, mitochondrial-like isoform X4 [Scylla paramamosain]|uniref:acyl-coenzyme A thioesterase 9, mitochondrial-like isoform X4 n=1 Tax=Scylla paramamosain TaxID=85552 RepID=UPI0030837923
MSLGLLSRVLPQSYRNGSKFMKKIASEGCLPNPSVAAAPGIRFLHMPEAGDTPTQTIRDVISNLTSKVGAARSFTETVDRSHLLLLLPCSQDELPTRTMKDSWDSAIIPLGSEERLREKYVTFMGGVRVGRLLEDLDVFAVWLCYKHIKNPHQTPDLPSPYSIVTALVDRIDFSRGWSLHPDRDIRLSGHVSWAGRSSLETVIIVEQRVDNAWRQVTRAVFVMVARDPLNQGSAVVNPLVCETPEEKRIYQAGEVNKLHRKMLQEESLFRVPPNETEKTLVHELFMSLANPKELSFTSKKEPENSVWMEDTKLKNLIICHPEVVYTEGSHMQISTKASVMDAATSSINLTNIFHFTFEADQPVPASLPKTYHESMLYLDGRRHYQLVTGVRKFYGQGETSSDSSL